MKKIKNKIVSGIVNEFKKITDDVSKQLVIGISAIVLISTVIIAVIFLTQYRNLTLKKAEEELLQRAGQFSAVANLVLQEDSGRPKEVYFRAIRDMTGTELWVVNKSSEIVLTTSTITDMDLLSSRLNDLTKAKKETTTYDYSKHFNNKTLTVSVPVYNQNEIIGYVVLHRDVNSIYLTYSLLNYLVFISLLISLILSIILSIIYANYFITPLEEITGVARKIRDGDYKVKTNIKRDDQIGTLALTIDDMTSEIDRNINEIKELENRAKELVANVSHEFKTPLTLIRGYTMNLLDNSIKATPEVYEKIIHNTVILEKLVNELLELNRFQSGKVVLKKEKINLMQLVIELVSDMKTISLKKDINIVINNKLKKARFIEADYTKMHQLLTIFLDNAIKYSKEKTTVTIEVRQNSLKIIDQGKGMAPSELENLFNRYYRINEEDKGYGLGLCIAKYITDAHGYRLKIDSEKDKGTVVTLSF